MIVVADSLACEKTAEHAALYVVDSLLNAWHFVLQVSSADRRVCCASMRTAAHLWDTARG
jgi:hypothetical protein